ncbi:MAG: hypothetical protein K9N06_13940 [Candidatus Cloacimonetes bacterium]|nr:hypothetical protein [Candidatus Cloacimonadota bacterium]
MITTINDLKAIIFSFLLLLQLTSQADIIQLDDIYVEYMKRDARIAVKLGRRLAEDISHFQKQIGQYPELSTHLVISADESDYESKLDKSREIMEFSQAYYSPRTRTIYIRNPRDGLNYRDLNRIVFHEYIHHFVFHYFSNAPLWFHEGMAVFFSNDFSQGRELNLAAQYFMKNTRPLSSMQEYPDNRIEWESYYAKSALAVRYLFTKRQRGFSRLWEKAEPQRKFNAAFQRSFYQTVYEFSRNFEEYQSNHFKSMGMLFMGSILWMLLPFLFLFSIWRRKVQEKQLLRDMEAEEPVDIEYIYEIEIDEDKPEPEK